MRAAAVAPAEAEQAAPQHVSVGVVLEQLACHRAARQVWGGEVAQDATDDVLRQCCQRCGALCDAASARGRHAARLHAVAGTVLALLTPATGMYRAIAGDHHVHGFDQQGITRCVASPNSHRVESNDGTASENTKPWYPDSLIVQSNVIDGSMGLMVVTKTSTRASTHRRSWVARGHTHCCCVAADAAA